MTNESLSLDYQTITYNGTKDTTYIGINYTGHCSQLAAQFFTRAEILNSSTQFPNFVLEPERNTKNVSIQNSRLSLLATDPLFFRIVAVEEDNTVCSGRTSLQTFYRFDKRGNSKIVLIEVWCCMFIAVGFFFKRDTNLEL